MTVATRPTSSPVTFCENVTPTTYAQTRHSLDHLEDLDLDALNELQSSLLPGFEPCNAGTTTKRRRGPPHRRRSQGHIPRPPNAFMMFRQNFCKSSQFKPGMTDERDSLSRLLGKEWRQLPAEEKSYWDLVARIEKERHKRLYPDYKFKPVHKKRKQVQEPAGSVSKQRISKKRTSPAIDDESGELNFSMDIAKQRELQLERNSYITELYKCGYKTEQLGPFMKRFDAHHRQKALGLSRRPAHEEELDADSHSDSATLFDDGDGYSSTRKLNLDIPSPSGSRISSPATLAYSQSSSPAPFTLPTVPRLSSLVPAEGFTGSCSSWGYQQPRRSSSVPLPFGQWEDNLFNPSLTDSTFHSTYPAPPLSPPPMSIMHPGFCPSEMDPEYTPMSIEHRCLIGERRASSAGGMRRSWGSLSKLSPSSTYGQEDFSTNRNGNQWGWMQGTDGGMFNNGELPEVEPGLFQPNFDLSAGGLGLSSVSPHLDGAVSPLDAPSPLDSLPLSFNAEEVQIIAPQPVSPVPLQTFDALGFLDSGDSSAMVDAIMNAEFVDASEDGLVFPLEVTN